VRRATLLALAVAVVSSGAIAGRSAPEPQLDFARDVPGDVQELAAATWDEFLVAHSARLGCIADVTLAAAWELDSRGEYLPEAATITIRIPGTAATLRDELVHEFAHHVDFTCPDIVELRPGFLAAQGLPATASWFEAPTWEATPSEQFAEATVAAVLGSRAQHREIHLTESAVALVRAWGLGL
jgi:hypothetical protein